MGKKNFFESLGDAFSWAQGLKRDTDAILNIDANRSHLLRRVQEACSEHGFDVELVHQPAVLPALEVAVRLGDARHSKLMEYGGDQWQNIVPAIADQLEYCQDATIFVQLEARDARAFVCCTQPRARDDNKSRSVILVDVTDDHNLVDAYKQAHSSRS